MPKQEIGWWKKRHDTRNRDSVRKMIVRYGMEGYGMYVRLVDRMREMDDGEYKLHIDDDEVYVDLLDDLRIPKEKLDQFIEDSVEKYGYFRQHDGYLWCPELCEDMDAHDAVKEKRRLGAQRTNDKRWPQRGAQELGELLPSIGQRRGNGR